MAKFTVPYFRHKCFHKKFSNPHYLYPFRSSNFYHFR